MAVRKSSSPEYSGVPKAVTFAVRNGDHAHVRRRRQSLESSGEEEDEELSTCSETWEVSWSAVNDRKVTEISLGFFYQPRTLSLLLLVVLALIYVAFVRDDSTDPVSNVATGLYTVTFLFLSIGLLVFPNGPFTRPHPAFWRLVFGTSMLYFFLLSFALFQRYSDIRTMLGWIDPVLIEGEQDNALYSIDCRLNVENVISRIDIFVVAHFVGWVFKALLIRHYGLLWTISIMWECTELFFAHVLPNFAECWWDAFVFDILICNGLGIHVGMHLCRRLEVRHFHWESIKKIKGTRGKLRRAVLQFTPMNWLKIRWLDPRNTSMRILALFLLIMIFQVTELNTFLLKHIFYVKTNHPLVSVRLLIMCLMAAPSLRQYYVYITDKTCHRLGTQAWLFFAIMIVELLISVKFGMGMLPAPALMAMLGWLGVAALVSVVAVWLMTRRVLSQYKKGGVSTSKHFKRSE